MSKRLEQDIRDWLAAESAGADEQAEQALGRAFGHLERSKPSLQFTGNVLRAAGFGTTRPALPAYARVAALVALVVAGCTLAAAPGLVLVVLGPIARLADWSVVAFWWRATTQWIGVASTWWGIAADVAGALRLSLTSPGAAAVLLANVAVAAASLFGLRRLLANDEEFVEC